MTREEERIEAAKANYPEDAILRRACEVGAKWADKTIIDKACEWIDRNNPPIIGGDYWEDFIEAFRKAMEE